MEFNTFNSPIPTEIGLLPNLQFIYARGADINGDLSFMRTASNLRKYFGGSRGILLNLYNVHTTKTHGDLFSSLVLFGWSQRSAG
jgi:hypothetical protein